jgi:hypothetical protein
MDHLDWNLEPRLARDEDDATPVSLPHATHVVAGEPNAAHDVALEEAHPVRVRDLEEGLWLEDAHVVDEDVELREGGDHPLATLGTAHIGGDALDAGLAHHRAQPGKRLIDPLLSAAVDDDSSTLAGERRGGRKADAGGRAGDESTLAGESEIHGSSSWVQPGVTLQPRREARQSAGRERC